MKESNNTRQRMLKWLKRFLWLVYGLFLILFAQAAWASLFENELRAAVIYLSVVIVLVLAGLISCFSRYIEN
jgi:Zn-dependent protease with chaperone function